VTAGKRGSDVHTPNSEEESVYSVEISLQR